MAKLPQINQINTSNTTINLSSTWGIRSTYHFLSIVLIFLVISIFYFNQYDGSKPLPPSSSSPPPSKNNDFVKEMVHKCDYFSGKWVFDNVSHPLYKEKECSFMADQLACERYGRKDLNYQYWRWQPNHCDLLRYVFIYFFRSKKSETIFSKSSHIKQISYLFQVG